MSSCIDAISEKLCYIPCKFCNILLAVGVPCSSLMDTVTVRCGHCSNMWSVNMAASAAAFHSQSSFTCQEDLQQVPNYTSPYNYHSNRLPTHPSSTNVEEERTVNRPPEKKQRVPSAYNQFIKEEIQRIKTNNPDISHREAFSSAAKNWAHFPRTHFGLILEANKNRSK